MLRHYSGLNPDAVWAEDERLKEEEQLKEEVTELRRESGRLMKEVSGLKKEVKERKLEAERLKEERDGALEKLKAVFDEGGEGAVSMARRETERVRYCAAWLKLRVVQLERGCEVCKGREEELDEIGEEIKEEMLEKVGMELEEGRDWRDGEIEELQRLLGVEHEMRMELEGVVEELAGMVQRQEEEEERVANRVLEKDRRRAEEELKVAREMLEEEKERRRDEKELGLDDSPRGVKQVGESMFSWSGAGEVC